MTSGCPTRAAWIPLLLCACSAVDGASIGEVVAPLRSDATTGGTAGFYFLPSLAPAVAYPGVFDDRLRPDAVIEEVDLQTGSVGAEVARFEQLRAYPAIEAYVAAVQTGEHFAAGQGYRINIESDGVELGFADVAAVATPAQRDTVPAGFVGVVVGANLKVRFRIEQGVLDQDGDGVLDAEDVCPAVADPDQADTDGDPRLRRG
jgi:hypothetical protein